MCGPLRCRGKLSSSLACRTTCGPHSPFWHLPVTGCRCGLVAVATVTASALAKAPATYSHPSQPRPGLPYGKVSTPPARAPSDPSPPPASRGHTVPYGRPYLLPVLIPCSVPGPYVVNPSPPGSTRWEVATSRSSKWCRCCYSGLQTPTGRTIGPAGRALR